MAKQKRPLDTAKDALEQARKQRKSAKTNLQGAEKSLQSTQQNLSRLQGKERQLQNRQTENAARAESLPHEIQATQQKLEKLQAEQQKLQNQEAQNPGTLAHLIRKLIRKPARLTGNIHTTQQKLEKLQAEQQKLPVQQAEDAAELERLKPQIEEARQTVKAKEDEVEELHGKLNVAKSDVLEKASEVNNEASKEIINQAWKLEVVPDSLKTWVGGASTSYASIPVTNLAYNSVFYYLFGINIFKYSQLQDFVIPKPESLLSLNIFIWIIFIYAVLKYLRSYKSPVLVERLAGVLSSIATSLKETKGKFQFLLPLFLLSFIIVPGVVACKKAKSISDSNKIAHVVTVSELKPVKESVHIGSSSTHAFFLGKNLNKTQAGAIPLSGIVCISDEKDEESYCEPSEQIVQIRNGPDGLDTISLKEEYNLWIKTLLEENVTKKEILHYISQQKPSSIVIVYSSAPDLPPPPQDQPCEDCIPPALTDGMQFYLVHQEPASLEAPRGIEISGINERWLRAFKPAVEACSEPGKPGKPVKLRIDGFASSEPPRHLTSPESKIKANIYNCKVANRRAEKAIDSLIGKNQGYGTSEAECQEERQEERLFSFGTQQGLNFEIEYRPWQTFQTMEKSRPVIDELEGTVIPERTLLNRSVRLTIVDAGGCKPPPSTPPNANEAPRGG